MSVSRRTFLLSAGAGLFAGRRLFGTPPAEAPAVRFGMVTDVHYADLPPDPAPLGVIGRRYYRESLNKLAQAVDVFNARKLDFAIELGDFKDETNGREGTLRHLEAVEAGFARFNGPRYHVAGNHDFDCLTPEEFFSRTPNDGRVTQTGYYAFVRGGITFVVLNACYNASLRPYVRKNTWDDANVPPEELAWLEKTLAAAGGPVIVFCHQRLEDSAETRHIVKNATAVRAILEKSGKVKGVITGHQHKGGVRVLNGIVYYSLRALVCDCGEGANSFAEVAVYPSGAFTVTGWRSAVSLGAKGEFPETGLVAHRGDMDAFPENTLPAFESAVRQGAEMVELDVWRCKSGEWVVMHDARVDRTTNGTGRIADLTLEEIKALDAGVKKGPAFAGMRVPTFDEALAVFPKTGVYLNIHCKTREAGLAAASRLRRTGRLAQGIVMLDKREDFLAVKEKCPWVKAGLVIATPGWGKPWTREAAWRQIRDAAKTGVAFLQILPNSHCTARQLVFLHDHGIRTTYFAAHTPGAMVQVVKEGHDFVFTDRLSALRRIHDETRPPAIVEG